MRARNSRSPSSRDTPAFNFKFLNMLNNFLGKRLLFLVAHPDDESFAAAGTIYKNRKAGGENAIVCVTRGGRGKSHLAKPHTARELKAIRTRELRNAARFLGVRHLHILDFPDGKVAGNKSKVYKKFLNIARRFGPDFIFGFGPDGISGHLDHIAAGSVAEKAAKKLGVPFVAFAASPRLVKNFHHLKKRRKFGVYSRSIRHAAHDLKIAVDPGIKLKTLRFHVSQIGDPRRFTRENRGIAKNFLRYEYFRLR